MLKVSLSRTKSSPFSNWRELTMNSRAYTAKGISLDSAHSSHCRIKGRTLPAWWLPRQLRSAHLQQEEAFSEKVGQRRIKNDAGNEAGLTTMTWKTQRNQSNYHQGEEGAQVDREQNSKHRLGHFACWLLGGSARKHIHFFFFLTVFRSISQCFGRVHGQRTAPEWPPQQDCCSSLSSNQGDGITVLGEIMRHCPSSPYSTSSNFLFPSLKQWPMFLLLIMWKILYWHF